MNREKIREKTMQLIYQMDINGEFEKIAAAYNIGGEEVKASIAAEAIAEDMKVQKAMTFVKEKAVITTKNA